MKRFLLTISCLLLTVIAMAQPPRMELGPGGFPQVVIPLADVNAEKLIDLTQAWAVEFNRRKDGFDVTNVTANTVTITANKENAFFYRVRGQAFDHEIRYEMQIEFREDSYVLNFNITEIYNNNKRVEYTIPDYFTRDGELKEGYDDLERSLEATVNNIVRSHYNYLVNFR